MLSAHTSYNIPSGSEHTLLFESPAYLDDARFILGGNAKALRIRRIAAANGCSPNVVFYEASPHEVTVHFAQNPGVQVMDLMIYVVVANLSEDTQALQISALGERYEGVVPTRCVILGA